MILEPCPREKRDNKLLGAFYPNETVLFLTFIYGVCTNVCNALCMCACMGVCMLHECGGQGVNLLSSQISDPLNKA